MLEADIADVRKQRIDAMERSIREAMRGETGTAAAYVALSVAGSLMALATGLWLGGMMTR